MPEGITPLPPDPQDYASRAFTTARGALGQNIRIREGTTWGRVGTTSGPSLPSGTPARQARALRGNFIEELERRPLFASAVQTMREAQVAINERWAVFDETVQFSMEAPPKLKEEPLEQLVAGEVGSFWDGSHKS